MESYGEMVNRHAEETRAIPYICAFSWEQLLEELQARGFDAHKDDSGKVHLGLPAGEKLVHYGMGMYSLKSDQKAIRSTIDNQRRELHDAMCSQQFAYEAFLYEMRNTEYYIDPYEGDYRVCSTFGRCEYGDEKDWIDYLDELGYPSETFDAFERAKCDYSEECEKNGWF